MKLCDAPRGSKVKVLGDYPTPIEAPEIKKGDILTLYNIDGMYSYCVSEKGEVVHLAAWAEVELIN